MPKVLIAGASKGVGFKLAKYLREKGVDVVAMLRSDDAKAKLEGIGAAVVKADALDGGAVRVAFSDAGSIDAVACTVGGKPGDTARADYPGAKNCIDAAKAAGIERFLLVSSISAGDTRRFLPPPLLERLGPVIDEKGKAEAYLRESGLKYTIVRPGGLESDSATGNGILTETPSVLGGINRAEVAQLLARCLHFGSAVGRTFTAVDRGKVRSQGDYETVELS